MARQKRVLGVASFLFVLLCGQARASRELATVDSAATASKDPALDTLSYALGASQEAGAHDSLPLSSHGQVNPETVVVTERLSGARADVQSLNLAEALAALTMCQSNLGTVLHREDTSSAGTIVQSHVASNAEAAAASEGDLTEKKKASEDGETADKGGKAEGKEDCDCKGLATFTFYGACFWCTAFFFCLSKIFDGR